MPSTISSSVVPCSSCPQSFPASGYFPMSQLFTSGGQSIGASASASVLSMNIQGWFPLGLTVLISLQVQGPLKSLFPYFCIPSLPWLATVWICPLALREDLGGWMKLISCKQETQDMKSLFAQKPTESYSVSVDSLQDIPQWNFEDWFSYHFSSCDTVCLTTEPCCTLYVRDSLTL